MQNNIAIISQRWRTVRAQLPHKVGALMLRFTEQRFREQAWVDNATQPWKNRKGNVDPGRAILVGKGTAHLKRSIYIVRVTENSVTIGSDLPYAKAHNDGFRGTVTVPAHTRKQISSEKVVTGKTTKKGKPRTQTNFTIIGEVNVKTFSRRMNLPRRRYMGNSAVLNQQMKRLFTAEVNSIFK